MSEVFKGYFKGHGNSTPNYNYWCLSTRTLKVETVNILAALLVPTKCLVWLGDSGNVYVETLNATNLLNKTEFNEVAETLFGENNAQTKAF